jgi:hypothetical protein
VLPRRVVGGDERDVGGCFGLWSKLKCCSWQTWVSTSRRSTPVVLSHHRVHIAQGIEHALKPALGAARYLVAFSRRVTPGLVYILFQFAHRTNGAAAQLPATSRRSQRPAAHQREVKQAALIERCLR